MTAVLHPPVLHSAVRSTPVGPLALVVDGDVLVAAGFTADPGELRARLTGVRATYELRPMSDLGAVTKAVEAYLDGDLTAPDELVVEQNGTPGQQAVWAALRAVPAGTTASYAELARRCGSPTAVRAAGSACGRNLVAPVIPCHRAVRSDGSLGGYFYGLPVKEWLLAHERRHGERDGGPGIQPNG